MVHLRDLILGKIKMEKITSNEITYSKEDYRDVRRSNKMKRKMNKKLLLFGLPVILALAFVAAATYYALVTVNVNVNQPISVTGELTQEVDCDAGDTCYGSDVTISNDGDSEREVDLSATEYGSIKTSFVSEIVLTEKTVDFGNEPWLIPEDADEVKVRFTLVGDEFNAEVIEDDNAEEHEDYVLIYYKDNSDRWNSPAKAILVEDVSGNLPYMDDANADEYNYCSTGEYSTCHGAKLWYVPEDAINEDDSLDWSRASEFFYETYLIHNSDGKIIVYPDSSITFKPMFEIDKYLGDGTYPVTITVA